jgi:hypothetical protein
VPRTVASTRTVAGARTVTPDVGLASVIAVGAYASVPNSAALQITGDIDVRALIKNTAPNSSQNIICKRAGGNAAEFAFRMAGGAGTSLEMYWFETGPVAVIATSTAPLTAAQYTGKWVRATRSNTGAGGNWQVTFYTSPDGNTWTQLGSQVVGSAPAAPFSTTNQVLIGAFSTSASTQTFAGTIFRTQVFNGINGTVQLDANFAIQNPGTTSFTETSSNAATITIAGADSISGRKFAINRQFVFNPLTDITWLHSGWAGDPQWSRPGDGNKVANWRDVGGANPSQATASNQPTYRSTVSALNNREAIQFVAASNQVLDTAITPIVATSTPVTIVIIGINTDGANSNAERVFGEGNVGNSGIGKSSSNFWINFGATSATTADTNPHILSSYFTGASGSFLKLDGTTILSGSASSGPTINRTTIGAGSDGTPTYAFYINGYVAFWGIYNGDMTTDANYTNFKRWVSAYYGFAVN